ncbi:hypothetical protein EON67_00860 [archaeon]|nr:MAG: hypothetical protein EON67_00860 [archaeon]
MNERVPRAYKSRCVWCTYAVCVCVCILPLGALPSVCARVMPSSRFLSRALTATLLVASTCVSAAVPLDDALTRATLLVRKVRTRRGAAAPLSTKRVHRHSYSVCAGAQPRMRSARAGVGL